MTLHSTNTCHLQPTTCVFHSWSSLIPARWYDLAYLMIILLLPLTIPQEPGNPCIPGLQITHTTRGTLQMTRHRLLIQLTQIQMILYSRAQLNTLIYLASASMADGTTWLTWTQHCNTAKAVYQHKKVIMLVYRSHHASSHPEHVTCP